MGDSASKTCRRIREALREFLPAHLDDWVFHVCPTETPGRYSLSWRWGNRIGVYTESKIVVAAKKAWDQYTIEKVEEELQKDASQGYLGFYGDRP